MTTCSMPFAPLHASPRLHRSLEDAADEVQPRRLSLASFASPVPTTEKVEPKTPVRDQIASTANMHRGTNGRVSAAGWEQVIMDLQHACIMMSLKGVKKIGYLWWQQKKASVPVTKISVARKRSSCEVATELTPAIARGIMAIQAKHYGQLSYRRVCAAR